MNRPRTALIAVTVAAAALLSAASASAASGLVPGGGAPAPVAGETAPPPAAADIAGAAEPVVPQALGTVTAFSGPVRASVGAAFAAIPGFDQGRLAQILKNLGQGTL